MNQYTVWKLEDILSETGVCALLEGKQVAIFRTKDNKLFALDNYDRSKNLTQTYLNIFT